MYDIFMSPVHKQNSFTYSARSVTTPVELSLLGVTEIMTKVRSQE